MHVLSRGLFPEECRREERVIRADFAFLFLTTVGLAVGTRLVVWLVHGQ